MTSGKKRTWEGNGNGNWKEKLRERFKKENWVRNLRQRVEDELHHLHTHNLCLPYTHNSHVTTILMQK